MAFIYKTNGEIKPISPKNGTDFTLEELQAIVGGYIETIRLDYDRIMVVNEEGKLMNLPLNERATAKVDCGLIVGDVLICDEFEIK